MTHPAERLRALEQRARRRFGQNFLVGDTVADRIATFAHAGDRVLEIGPGLGVLSRALLRRGAVVTAIELDRDLASALREDLPEVTLIEGDALRVALPPVDRVVANLPYNVATPLLLRLLPLQIPMALMFQKEVGERIVAAPGGHAYGSLSVHVQVRAHAAVAIELGPGAFHPAPRVHSVVVHFTPRTPDFGGVAPDVFDRVVRAGFSARRKTLLNALSSRLERDGAAAVLAAAGVDPGLRAERVDLDGWRRIARATAHRWARDVPS